MDCLQTYIYSLSHPITGEIRYVGKADVLKNRMWAHLNDKGQTHKRNWIASLKKDGLLPVMEQVDVVQKNNWQFWEQYYISLFRSWGFNLVNGTYGGEGRTNLKHSNETKSKMSASLKEAYKNPELRKLLSDRKTGVACSESAKEKLSKINSGSGNPFFGKSLSDEHKEKIRQRHIGRVYSDETIEKMKNAIRPAITDETKRNMSKARIGNKNRLGIKHTDEDKRKISEASKLMWKKRKEAKCLTA